MLKVKVNLLLCLIKHHEMKRLCSMELLFSLLLILHGHNNSANCLDGQVRILVRGIENFIFTVNLIFLARKKS
jgi:hypothetical protein